MHLASAANGEHVECPGLTLIAGFELRDSPEKLILVLGSADTLQGVESVHVGTEDVELPVSL